MAGMPVQHIGSTNNAPNQNRPRFLMCGLNAQACGSSPARDTPGYWVGGSLTVFLTLLADGHLQITNPTSLTA